MSTTLNAHLVDCYSAVTDSKGVQNKTKGDNGSESHDKLANYREL